MHSPPKEMVHCNLCGAVIPDGLGNCDAIFHTVLEREYRDPAFGEAHLFSVDAYALQHSEKHSPRSNAFHLMRLCWLVEHGGSASIRQAQRQGHVRHDSREESYRRFPFLEPPVSRGDLTVSSLLPALTPEDHQRLAQAWGRSVWTAWSGHQTWAREQARRWYIRTEKVDAKAEKGTR